MRSVTVRLAAFEGPLDLLYHLIEKNEIDIYDIPIAELTDQYLEYLNASDAKDMENLSAFLVMAADLLEIKSKMLLPKDKTTADAEEEDPREALVAKLLEYKRYKAAAEIFMERAQEAEQRLYKAEDGRLSALREQTPPAVDEVLRGITMDDIFQAFAEVLKRKAEKVDHVRSGFREVPRDRFTVAERAGLIRDLLLLHPRLRFAEIFSDNATKMEVVVTFLALLDLMKAKDVYVRQETQFGEIYITGREET